MPPVEVCNGSDDDCDGACDEGFTCCAGSTVDCAVIGDWFAGTAVCQSDCSGWDAGACSNCGDGVVAASEQCDGVDLGGETCLGLGYDGGDLACLPACTFDKTGCTGFDPSGSYSISPPPTYSCAWGLVNFVVANMTFVDSGATLLVDLIPLGIGCVMTGASAEATRHIDITCTDTGTCDETYALVGDFSDDDTWSGTLTVDFTPTAGSCFDCVHQSWPVSGSRL